MRGLAAIVGASVFSVAALAHDGSSAISTHGTSQSFPIWFPFVVVAMWIVVTTILAAKSGWFQLMKRFPDQPDEPRLRLRALSGSMSGVSMSNILRLSASTAGLRVGILRPFGPFSKDFFVPWNDLVVTRSTRLFSPVARLQFGNPEIGNLTVPAYIANRIARAVGGRWPESGPFPEETPSGTLSRLFIQWAITTGLAALFFTLAPLLVAPKGARPPVLVAVLFPAIVFGLFSVVRFFRERM